MSNTSIALETIRSESLSALASRIQARYDSATKRSRPSVSAPGHVHRQAHGTCLKKTAPAPAPPMAIRRPSLVDALGGALLRRVVSFVDDQTRLSNVLLCSSTQPVPSFRVGDVNLLTLATVSADFAPLVREYRTDFKRDIAQFAIPSSPSPSCPVPPSPYWEIDEFEEPLPSHRPARLGQFVASGHVSIALAKSLLQATSKACATLSSVLAIGQQRARMNDLQDIMAAFIVQLNRPSSAGMQQAAHLAELYAVWWNHILVQQTAFFDLALYHFDPERYGLELQPSKDGEYCNGRFAMSQRFLRCLGSRVLRTANGRVGLLFITDALVQMPLLKQKTAMCLVESVAEGAVASGRLGQTLATGLPYIDQLVDAALLATGTVNDAECDVFRKSIVSASQRGFFSLCSQ